MQQTAGSAALLPTNRSEDAWCTAVKEQHRTPVATSPIGRASCCFLLLGRVVALSMCQGTYSIAILLAQRGHLAL